MTLCSLPNSQRRAHPSLRPFALHLLRALCLLGFFALVFSGCGLTGYGARSAHIRRPVYHTVKGGENLPAIAERYGVSVNTLIRLNGISAPQNLTSGQRLLVGYRSDGEGPVVPAVRRSAVQTARAHADTGSAFISRGRLGWPVNTGWVASRFGPRRSGFHDGLDFAAATGSPVLAAHSGEVVYAGNGISGYGNMLIVRGDDKLMSVYAHNSELLVQQGERVKKAQRIAEVGQTGRAQGPHLHFEVRARDSKGRYVAVDPWPLLNEKDLKTRPRYRVNDNLFAFMSKIFQ